MNAYTTIEQSKKLLELGLNSETADACYDVGYGQIKAHIECENFTSYFTNDEYPELKDRYIPCWSLVALLNIIDNNGLVYDISNDKNREFAILVYEADYTNQEVKFHHTEHSVVDMIIWLLEHNYIKSNKNE